MKISIIGQGYVGLNLAMAIPNSHQVIGFDVNAELVSCLSKGQSHIEGIASDLIARKVLEGSYIPTTNVQEIKESEIVIIAVPTPLDANRQPDLSYIESACLAVASVVKSITLIINESTSSPGTLRGLIKRVIEENSPPGLIHEYAVSPERVDPGNRKWNLFNTPRLYAGLTPESSRKTREFYGSFCGELLEVSSPEVAEAAKLFENTFRQVNIALVNEFAQITHALGISVYETLDAANTKPYGFMKFLPGAGVGGHCIPVDPSYLLATALDLGVPAKFINLANETNLDMANYVIKRVIEDNPPDLKGKKIQIIGVSYKSDVADTREAPAGRIIDTLRSFGANVDWHDPLVDKWRGETSSPLGASDISILVTRHAIFSNQAILDSAPYVFDTTGVLDGTASL
jgi:UDP-N-acetyl-D-glucosamine dehydrogenase